MDWKLFPGSALFQQWGTGLSETQQEKAQEFLSFGYKAYLSHQLPLNRALLDRRERSSLPALSVIFIFLDEARSVMQQAVARELKAPLDEEIQFYNQKYPGLLKLTRHTKRKGLAQARNTGWKAATANVVAILDSHIEVNVGWAEPTLAGTQEDLKVIVSPVFDKIGFDTFQLVPYKLAVEGFNWKLWCRYGSLPQAWLDLHDPTAPCGGRAELLPCSWVTYVERHHKPYILDVGIVLKRNAIRAAEIWMDDYKHMVYTAWNIPLQPPEPPQSPIFPLPPCFRLHREHL
ncbi:putative polypeptide N-acetylgalactosaminyltransferase 8 [Thomomys bottae]